MRAAIQQLVADYNRDMQNIVTQVIPNFNVNCRISYLEEGRVRSSVELVGVGVMGLNGQVLHQSHTVDVEEHSHQGLEGRKGRAGTLMGRVIRE